MSDIYLVVAETEEGHVENLAHETWEQSLLLSAVRTGEDPIAAVVMLVRDTKRTTKDIADLIIGDDDEALCVVFDVGKSPYSGRHYTGLWEWLKKAGTK